MPSHGPSAVTAHRVHIIKQRPNVGTLLYWSWTGEREGGRMGQDSMVTGTRGTVASDQVTVPNTG